jgi:hypothetical protein
VQKATCCTWLDPPVNGNGVLPQLKINTPLFDER